VTHKLCLTCSKPFKGPGARCAEHRRAKERDRSATRREDPAVQVRSSVRWQRLREKIMRRDKGCTWGRWPGDLEPPAPPQRCSETRREKLTVHHVDGAEANPWDERKLRTLCYTHHNRLEARIRAEAKEESMVEDKSIRGPKETPKSPGPSDGKDRPADKSVTGPKGK
jgi:hypothetical protein